ncbi:MAG: GGDEF domain-containing protein [Lachnospiraceae bacterium]|nr:GGDEF domain-containing protein [Lachnospiraceae bacterium]
MKTSLRNKIAILLVIFALILSASGLVVSNRVLGRMLDERYKSSADQLAATTAQIIDSADVKVIRDAVLEIYDATENKVGSEDWGSPEFDEYVSRFSSVEDIDAFDRLIASIRRIQDVNDVNCIYAIAVDPVGKAVIYLADASYDDACPPGVFDPLYEMNFGVIDDHERGFPAYVTNTEEYGWLVTAGAPVHYEGKVIAYIFVDVSMDMIKAQQRNFTYMLVGLQLVLTVVITLLAMVYIYKSLVKPVNMLSEVAAHYGEDSSEFTYDEFAGLDIHTGDEIETLHKSMVKMEKDIDAYITNLTETREELSSTKKVADQMETLANTDALTGVRNKLAYAHAVDAIDKQIKEGFTRFGIAMIDLNDLKVINDSYGHDKGDKAITSLCDAICRNFKHSPVFRIGGDEFAAILINDDYENAEAAVTNFHAAMDKVKKDESLDLFEKVSAAVGYSLFDPETDTCTEDVFRRADNLMYENKKSMKSRTE